MAHRNTLTEKQVALLRWIADGCPEGIMDDHFHRISAAALRNRGLITIAGHGPSWSSTLTKAGADYLRQLDGPDPPIPRQANTSVTQQLVDEVIVAGGTLRVPRRNWYAQDGVDYERRARLAERYGKVPGGKRLMVSAIENELEIRLVDAPDHPGGRAELVMISVPERVGRYHAAAKQFRECSELHEVSRGMLGRATRIIHVIAVETERRGWSTKASKPSMDGDRRGGRSVAKEGHLTISAQGHTFSLRLLEEGVHTRGHWEKEVWHYRNVSPDSVFYRDRMLPRGPYDSGATGKLKLELQTEQEWIYKDRQSRWADRQSWKLEERLSHLFREIEERIVEAERVAEEKRVAQEKAAELARLRAEEREREWHQLMDEAKTQLVEEHRAMHLRNQTEAWHEARDVRRYCDAMEFAYGDHTDTAQWLAWARAYAAQLDPLTRPPTLPEPPESTTQALQRYLPDGWSADGPEHGAARSFSRANAPG